MASVPSFDPNTFIPSIKAKDWKELRKDEAHPLINRAVSAFPPGSTFKIVTALAGLRKGLAKTRFTCYGGVTYGDHYFQCWINEKGGQHGTLGAQRRDQGFLQRVLLSIRQRCRDRRDRCHRRRARARQTDRD